MPAVKAVMARSIVEKHGLNEKQTAELLGLSQSAVSRYVSKERGNRLELESSAEALAIIDKMVVFIIKEPDNKTEILRLFCGACTTIRESGLMCPSCKKEMPKKWAENCFFCRS